MTAPMSRWIKLPSGAYVAFNRASVVDFGQDEHGRYVCVDGNSLRDPDDIDTVDTALSALCPDAGAGGAIRDCGVSVAGVEQPGSSPATNRREASVQIGPPTTAPTKPAQPAGEVRRWVPVSVAIDGEPMHRSKHGTYVLFSDFDAREAAHKQEVEALKAERDALQRKVERGR